MSKPIVISIPHELGRAEAKRRIDAGFGRLERQFSSGLAQVSKSWSEDRLSFSAKVAGQALTGRLDVMDASVRIEVDLPSLLELIAGRITGRLKRESQLLLEKK